MIRNEPLRRHRVRVLIEGTQAVMRGQLRALQNGREAGVDARLVTGHLSPQGPGLLDAPLGQWDIGPPREGFLTTGLSAIPNGIPVTGQDQRVDGRRWRGRRWRKPHLGGRFAGIVRARQC